LPIFTVELNDFFDTVAVDFADEGVAGAGEETVTPSTAASGIFPQLAARYHHSQASARMSPLGELYIPSSQG